MTIKCVAGKNGYLFLDNDMNRVIDQTEGRLSLSLEKIEAWKNEYYSRYDYCKRNGIRYFFFVAPNKHSIYPEYLPEHIKISRNRPIYQLDKHFEIFYPDKELCQKKHYPLYSKTDTHWNDIGSLVGANFLVSKIDNSIPLIRVERQKIERTKNAGDLGSKLKPIMKDEFFSIDLSDSGVIFHYENGLMNRGRTCLYRNANRNLLRAIMFCDSFGYHSMHKFLAEYFAELLCLHTANFDRNLIKKFKPNIVISQYVERFLIAKAPDSAGYSYFNEMISFVESGKYSLDSLTRFCELGDAHLCILNPDVYASVITAVKKAIKRMDKKSK